MKWQVFLSSSVSFSHLHWIVLGNTCDFDGSTVIPSHHGGQVFQASLEKATAASKLAKKSASALSWLLLPTPTQHCHQVGEGR